MTKTDNTSATIIKGYHALFINFTAGKSIISVSAKRFKIESNLNMPAVKASANKNAIGVFAIQTPQHFTYFG